MGGCDHAPAIEQYKFLLTSFLQRLDPPRFVPIYLQNYVWEPPWPPDGEVCVRLKLTQDLEVDTSALLQLLESEDCPGRAVLFQPLSFHTPSGSSKWPLAEFLTLVFSKQRWWTFLGQFLARCATLFENSMQSELQSDEPSDRCRYSEDESRSVQRTMNEVARYIGASDVPLTASRDVVSYTCDDSPDVGKKKRKMGVFLTPQNIAVVAAPQVWGRVIASASWGPCRG